MITRITGTQDILDLRAYTALTDALAHHLQRSGYHAIATPLLEPTALFHHSLGQETDVVSKEMYYVTTAHSAGGLPQECLRPEMTAPIMRAYCNAGLQEKEWKVFTVGPAFRHERPQKGRLRQFHQLSLEALHTEGAVFDAQLIIMLDRLFTQLIGMSHYSLALNYLGCAADRTALKTKLRSFCTEHQEKLCATCQTRVEKNILRILDCKNPVCQELYTSAPTTISCLCTQCALQWQTLTSLLEQLSVSYTVQPRLVRGLDYYEKTVFEFISPLLGAQSTFCGGGRYAGLATALGNKHDVPGIGAGIGIERLLMILEAAQTLPALVKPLPQPYVVIALGTEQTVTALLLADELLAAGLHCQTLAEGESSLKKLLKKADALQARIVFIIGSEERLAGTALVKNFARGSQQTIKLAECITYARSALVESV